MEKQKLLFHQARLSNRGVAEMVLLHISASKGAPSDMVMKTLELGNAILRGGNIDIQMVSTRSIIIIHYTQKIIEFIFFCTGNAQSFEREKRCRFLHINCWPYEFVQCLRFGCI